MVEYLKNKAKCFIMAATVICALPCAAETFNDPTRPPMGAESGLTGDAQRSMSSGPVLQSVSISKRRKVATIGGQEVAIGGKFGESTLIRISDSEVTLRNPDGVLETLRMYPQVEKKVILHKETKPAKKAANRAKPRE
jgi:MSHA biogenesis protein MshK